jgi:hypothetical protein
VLVIVANVVVSRLGGEVAVEMADSDVASCVFAARCSRQQGFGGVGQQRAVAVVGGDGSLEIDDRIVIGRQRAAGVVGDAGASVAACFLEGEQACVQFGELVGEVVVEVLGQLLHVGGGGSHCRIRPVS